MEEKKSKTYTAITIGPIIDTLNAARKTRELWGASYLFSYIIREIVLKLKNDNTDILLPYFEKESEWKNNLGAGLFPDRIFVKGEIDIKSLYHDVIQNISGKIEKWFKDNNKIKRKLNSKEIQDYLLSYFRLIQINFTCDHNENIIEKGSTLLDSKELQAKIIPENEFIDHENPLFYFLYHVNGSFLFKEGFGQTKRRFPSLIEIAIKEFELVDLEKYQAVEKKIEQDQEKFEDFYNEKEAIKKENDILEYINKQFSDKLKQPHKYIAIVQADGDKIGKIVTKVGASEKSIQSFSSTLMKFSKAASEIVEEYGGSPVYMGGDDLFFFAPLTFQKGESKTHILEMVDSLDTKFNEIVLQYAKQALKLPDNELPSLSFGISLSYYKFPLYEAMNMAFSALFEDIKWADKRNAIKVKFRKHSGQLMELFINKNEPGLWKGTRDFIRNNLDIDAEFLNSFTHKLRLQEDVLFDKVARNTNKLEFFFKNNYNENYTQYKDYFESLQSFIQTINVSVEKEEKKDYLYAVLRFIHFLRS